MNMKYISNIFALVLLVNFCSAQDYNAEFVTYFNKGDTAKQKEILILWEQRDNKNPELFTSYFNYFFAKSKKEMLTLTKDEPQGKGLSFMDDTGKTAGYIGSQITYNQKYFKKAIDKIDEGIKLYPDRLDMRFGKIHVLGLAEEWSSYTDEIIKTIQYSTRNNNHWTWTNNVEKDNGGDFLFSSLQDYQVRLYNTGDDSLLGYMQLIANEILKIIPNHVESLSNLAITYMLTEKYDEAIEVLLRAEELAPNDAIVLGNVAQGYKLKGDNAKAVEYYEKVTKIGDPDAVEYAKQQIKELRMK
jgi:tetratricopeptide (TPR) repeat protein